MSESIIDILSQGRERASQASKIYGLVPGIVTNNQDPEKLGRVKVRFPWLSDEVESWWARLAMPMAGPKRGFWIIPEVDDEVLVGFEHGDVRFPYVVGCLHNGVDKPPGAADSAPTKAGDDLSIDLRFMRSREGHVLLFDDTKGSEHVILADKTGKHWLDIDTSAKKIIITNDDGDIEIHAKHKVLIDCEDLEIKTRKDETHTVSGKLGIEVSQSMDLKSSGAATVKSSSSMTVEGSSSISCNGGTAEYKGGSMCAVKGALVKIN